MDNRTIILATTNKGKIGELAAHLQNFGLTVVGLDAFPEIPEVEETGVTFEENALLKASTIAKATGMVAVADDSGLEVDALDGAPGVYSARYAADDTSILPDQPQATRDQRNNAKLLIALQNVAQEKRTARFRCTMAVCKPSGEHMIHSGAWEGFIGTSAQGENGFGYDPLFVDAITGIHAAELSKEAKHARSHRGKALAATLAAWEDFFTA